MENNLLNYGVITTKLLGAGGGGFILCVFEKEFQKIIREYKLPYSFLPVELDLFGSELTFKSMKKRILLIGASGFVGRTVYQLFKEKSLDIKGIDLDDNTDYKIDILDNFNKLKELIFELKPYAIINLAAFSNSQQCNNNKEKVYALNVEFVEKLFEVCNRSNVKVFIHSSSEWIYGPGPLKVDLTLLPEKFYHKNLDLYSKSKLDSEISLIKLSRKSNLTTIINRFGIIYGNVKNRSNCVVDYIIKNYLEKKVINFRDPNSGRCFISIDDIAYAIYINVIKNYSQNKSNHILYNLQGPGFYQLSRIKDYLELNDIDILKSDFSDKKSDIKIIKSDFKNLTGKDPKCLSEYLDFFKNN